MCHGFTKTDKYILGNITSNSIEELICHKANTKWINMAPIKNDICLDCESIFICGGGCSMQSEALFGNVCEIDKAFCIHSKKSLLWLLEELYKHSKEQI